MRFFGRTRTTQNKVITAVFSLIYLVQVVIMGYCAYTFFRDPLPTDVITNMTERLFWAWTCVISAVWACVAAFSSSKNMRFWGLSAGGFIIFVLGIEYWARLGFNAGIVFILALGLTRILTGILAHVLPPDVGNIPLLSKDVTKFEGSKKELEDQINDLERAVIELRNQIK